jgi:hypothetical protein
VSVAEFRRKREISGTESGGSSGDVVQGRIVVVLIGDGEVVTVVAGVATGLGGRAVVGEVTGW